MKDFFVNLNDKVSSFIEPLWNKVVSFVSKDYYVVYAAISILLAILVIAGLFAVLRKAPKFFFLVLILLGIVVALWYFFVK